MKHYLVHWYERDFSLMPVQPKISVVLQKYNWAAIGGPAEADGYARGSRPSLRKLLHMLRYPVAVVDQTDRGYWWGQLDTVEIQERGYKVRATLDGMINRARVAFSYNGPGQSLASTGGQTSWGEDSASVTTYGYREAEFSQPDTDLAGAEARRAKELAIRAQPTRTIIHTPGVTGPHVATLHFRGLFDTLEWRFFEQTAGLTENQGSAQAEQGFGGLGEVQIAQSFQLAGAVPVLLSKVRVPIANWGSPGDSTIVEVCQNAAGVPGAVVEGVTTASSNYTDVVAWYEWAYSETNLLQPATTYWVLLRRSGAPNVHRYKVYVDENLGYGSGSFLVDTTGGPAWGSRVPDADLVFQVKGVRDTVDQIGDVVAASGQFLVGTTKVLLSSGVLTCPLRDGSQPGRQVIEELCQVGTTGGRRILPEVTFQRYLRLAEEPAFDPDAVEVFIEPCGSLTRWDGQPYDEPQDVVGKYVLPRDALAVEPGYLAGLERQLIERVEKDVASGQLRILEMRGEQELAQQGMVIEGV